MAIQFCSACGDALPESLSPTVNCDTCSLTNQNNLLKSVTKSSSTDFPSPLRHKLTTSVNDQQSSSLSATDTWGRADVACSNCHAPDVRYTAMQLRGADEGTTIFYFCPACSARWSDNN
ncbi:hypothetical protein L249_6788 [Ophiocordyceps polyrhachis-furcata BCC 54312]|uniref:DNA-directed RNA polymerase subunit n=1 Tax=Ophiocordyceps polyrhachis-furcata BCC 54312 TaxID=1330021 RepID=A0A367LK78_9HYPO|nr:hypothetical protein L249_6788 [Ophiocordyceps polyrhachis-furcata BCC 54312]